MISPTTPERLESRADRSAWTVLTRGVLRGAVLVLVLVFAVIAGQPQDRFTPMPGSGGVAVSEGSSGSGATILISSTAMADPDDGFDEAGGIVVPAPIVGRAVSRSGGRRAACAENTMPMVPERPPRTI